MNTIHITLLDSSHNNLSFPRSICISSNDTFLSIYESYFGAYSSFSPKIISLPHNTSFNLQDNILNSIKLESNTIHFIIDYNEKNYFICESDACY